MRPFPRWVTVLSLLAAALGAIDTSVLHLLPTDIGVAIVGVGAVLAYVSKHVVGDGIPPGFGIVGLVVAAFGTLNAITYPDPTCTPAADQVCQQVRLVSLLPPAWGTILAVLGAVGSAFAQAEHPATGLVPGTATITGKGQD